MLSVIKIKDIRQCLSEQDRGRPGVRWHHVGDPWSNAYAD